MLNLTTKLKRVFRSVSVLALTFTVLWASNSLQWARKDVDTAFQTGQPFVLVVADSGRINSDTNEAYADWAEYLNALHAQTDSRVKIIKLTALEYRQLIKQPKLKDQYATLFIRDAGHVLLYDGMILEPPVYRLGLAYVQNHPDEKADAANGLRETTVRR